MILLYREQMKDVRSEIHILESLIYDLPVILEHYLSQSFHCHKVT